MNRTGFAIAQVDCARLPDLLLPFPAYCLLPTAPLASGQEVVDKMVATVNAGVLPECRQICLITYSDLLWQLALQPDTPLDNPTSADLNRACTCLLTSD